MKKNYEIFSIVDTDFTLLPLEPEPLAERPLDIRESMSGITCTLATQEAISEGVASSPRRPELSLTRAYWYLLKFAEHMQPHVDRELCALYHGLGHVLRSLVDLERPLVESRRP